MSAVDPRAPCLIGVGRRTWHPEEVGEQGAPEPLLMWEEVARAAAADAGGRAGDLLGAIESVRVVHCLTWDYDDPPGRLAERLGVEPAHRHYSGIGGTTPQQLVNDAARGIQRGDLDLALVLGAEALATQRLFRKRGERYACSFEPEERRPFPWEAPFHPAEVAHDVFQAWLTFALWDNARRAHLGVGLAEYRRALGELLAPFTEVAARNPDAWYRVARSVDEIVTPTPDNRMVGYPYTKYMVAVMDVDQAAAVLVASHEAADRLSVPADRRVYLRGWCYATDPVYVAEHDEPWRSPAMAAAAAEALSRAGVDIDDVTHLDLYSCFASSVDLACDALGIAPGGGRSLTVTGGLPYHGGAGSNYLSHSIATMADVVRRDPGSYGVVSGVGMHMTKHVYAVYSTVPGAVPTPDEAGVQARLDALPKRSIVDEHVGPATVVAYSVVHGRDGAPEWGLAVCDVDGGGARCYAKVLDPALLARAEEIELVGTRLTLTPTTLSGPMGDTRVNVATV